MGIQKLTKEQAVIILGFTGILCGEFSDFHADVEKRLGRGVQTFEFGFKEFATEVKKLYEADFIEMGTVDKEQAKAQAVPEGFVLAKKELPEQIAEKMAIDRIDKPIHENDPVWSEIAEESYKNQVKLKKWEFWRDYKAMIEAQEPANDQPLQN